jgi:hypothetical protein
MRVGPTVLALVDQRVAAAARILLDENIFEGDRAAPCVFWSECLNRSQSRFAEQEQMRMS